MVRTEIIHITARVIFLHFLFLLTNQKLKRDTVFSTFDPWRHLGC